MAKLLVGSVKHSFDDKGRIRIPAKFREVLNGTLCVMPSLNGSLYVLPSSKSDDELTKMAGMELFDRDKQRSVTLVMANTEYYDVDAQGRVLLTADQQRLLGNAKDVVIVGKGTYAEIWPQEEWETKFNLLDPSNIDAVLEKMKEYGI